MKTKEPPERLDANEQRGRLIVSEHLGRYLWAAQLATGRSVLDAGCGTGYGLGILSEAAATRVVGVDISEQAVAQASNLNKSERIEIFRGDARDLPFSDREFDLVVCFEVIEHVDEREVVLDELTRVLGADGILCISTPNRRMYPSGNPYHVHEYEPEEFEQALGNRFTYVTLYRQTAWLASAILSDTEFAAGGSNETFSPRTIKTEPRCPGKETFTIALAGRQKLPPVGSLLTLGEPFEVRWWETRLNKATDERDERRSELAEREHERKEQGRVLLAVETELADAQDQMARLRITQAEIKQWAMKRAQEIALEKEKSELDRRDFENRLRRAERTIEDITGSLSWRITSPLRRAKNLFRQD